MNIQECEQELSIGNGWRRVLTSDGVIESLLGQMTSLIGSIKNLVVEDGEVKGKTQANGVGRGKLSLSDFRGSLVCFKRLVGRLLAAITDSKFGKVAVVVTLPIRGVSQSPLSWIHGVLITVLSRKKKEKKKQTNILW